MAPAKVSNPVSPGNPDIQDYWTLGTTNIAETLSVFWPLTSFLYKLEPGSRKKSLNDPHAHNSNFVFLSTHYEPGTVLTAILPRLP